MLLTATLPGEECEEADDRGARAISLAYLVQDQPTGSRVNRVS